MRKKLFLKVGLNLTIIKKLIINAERISYFKNKEEIFAEENVDLIINKENIKINTDKITFLKMKINLLLLVKQKLLLNRNMFSSLKM